MHDKVNGIWCGGVWGWWGWSLRREAPQVINNFATVPWISYYWYYIWIFVCVCVRLNVYNIFEISKWIISQSIIPFWTSLKDIKQFTNTDPAVQSIFIDFFSFRSDFINICFDFIEIRSCLLQQACNEFSNIFQNILSRNIQDRFERH